MRLKRNRIIPLFLYVRETLKDSEGGTIDWYGPAESFSGIAWHTSEELQQRLYGAVQTEAYSIKVDGKYERIRNGERISYMLENGTVISPLDGVCLEDGSAYPEYEIRVCRPYEHLEIEVVKIDRRIRKP